MPFSMSSTIDACSDSLSATPVPAQRSASSTTCRAVNRKFKGSQGRNPRTHRYPRAARADRRAGGAPCRQARRQAQRNEAAGDGDEAPAVSRLQGQRSVVTRTHMRIFASGVSMAAQRAHESVRLAHESVRLHGRGARRRRHAPARAEVGREFQRRKMSCLRMRREREVIRATCLRRREEGAGGVLERREQRRVELAPARLRDEPQAAPPPHARLRREEGQHAARARE
ncbi:hypothetical protein JKP88DRAFT_243406 [Tribonema minus]|uniref:Uncharacterized protein n=1 Tax=Tribonema minus TaxID=303371 RepID=A0A835ZBL1_9STRA|nr:hypothetical protein JKP88DRAFT_243406 [Tribonema minus]